MRILFFTFVFVLPLYGLVYGQQDLKILKSEFMVDNQDSREAWYHVKAGDRFYKMAGAGYTEAAKHYAEAIEFNPGNAELNYKMAVSLLMGDAPQDALPFFLKARSVKNDVASDIILLTGRAYQFRGDYGKAIDCFNMYSDHELKGAELSQQVSRFIMECNMAVKFGKGDADIKVINAEAVNSSQDDYSAVPVKDGRILYFTTRRQMLDEKAGKERDMKFNENIYLATHGQEGWSDAGPAGEVFVTDMNEGILWANNDNTMILIYAGWSGNGDILVSRYQKDEWQEPAEFMNDLASPERETSVAVTADGNEIFFTSGRKKGSQGGRDIFHITRIKKNKWTKPFNLGPLVNSPQNEDAVWTSVTGDTIWFSSDGLPGLGGYDIFMSVRDETGAFSDPVNMGIPVNSQWNDLFYRPSPGDRRFAWISSDRQGGKGGMDIYLLSSKPEPQVIEDTLNIQSTGRNMLNK